jgi:hypothetical protein
MAQHFLLSAAARTLSLRAICAGGERKAYRRFCALRWPETNGSPVCPRCGCLESYNLKARRRFKCAACSNQFSATSGTAVQLSRDLDVQYKTAFVLMHKLREAMAHETAEARLAGEVEIDGAYFGGHVRPTNAREDRIDRRLLKNRSSKRRVVIVLRQRGGRTLTRSFLREAEGR